MPKKISVNTGNAGEHLVMAELLIQGYHAFMADRSNPAYDISVYKNGKHSLLRVKTTTSGNVQYNVKKDGKTIFLEMRKKHDFVVIVNFSHRNKPKGLTGVRIVDFYIIPTHKVDAELHTSHSHWHNFSRRDGGTRKLTNRRVLSLHGKDTQKDISRGYDKKWEKYHDNNGWKQLDNP